MEKLKISIIDENDNVISDMPYIKKGKYVYLYQDTLCALKEQYIFGRNNIAKYILKSVVQLSRDIKKFPSLKKICHHNHDNKFLYASKWDLDNWLSIQKWKKFTKKQKRCIKKIKYFEYFERIRNYESSEKKHSLEGVKKIRDSRKQKLKWITLLNKIEKEYDQTDTWKNLREKEDIISLICPICGEKLNDRILSTITD